MCTSGWMAVGSSKVPTRMKRIELRPPYCDHSAVPQAGQRKTSCGRPLSVGMREGAASPWTSTRSASIKAFSTKAEPVCRWQSRQWQQWVIIGGEVIR